MRKRTLILLTCLLLGSSASIVYASDSFLGEVVEVKEDGSLIVKSLTGVELLKKNDHGAFEIQEQLNPGLLYTIHLIYDGETAEVGRVYRVKGQYDSQNNSIDVYHWTFFAEYYEELH